MIAAYRNSLSDTDYQKIAAVLGVNFLAAPNGVNAVMDGDFSSQLDVIAPPNGSGLIESLYLEYLNSLNIPSEPIVSASANNVQNWSVQRKPFRAVGGISSGSNGLKSTLEASVFGGTAGASYTPLFATLNDTVDK